MTTKIQRSKKTLGKGRRLTASEREAIAAAPASVGTAALAKQFDTTINTITRYRSRKASVAKKAQPKAAKAPKAAAPSNVTPISAASKKVVKKIQAKAASKKAAKPVIGQALTSTIRIPVSFTIEIDTSSLRNFFAPRAVANG